jgi:uncharacterized membrane protein
MDDYKIGKVKNYEQCGVMYTADTWCIHIHSIRRSVVCMVHCWAIAVLCSARYFWPQARQLVPLVNFLDQIRTLPVMMMICTVINYVTYHEGMGAVEENLHAFAASVL